MRINLQTSQGVLWDTARGYLRISTVHNVVPGPYIGGYLYSRVTPVLALLNTSRAWRVVRYTGVPH